MFMTVGDVTGGRGLRRLRGMADPRDAWYPGLGAANWGQVGAGAAAGAGQGASGGAYGAAAGAIIGAGTAYLSNQSSTTGALVGRGFSGRLRQFEQDLGLTRGSGAANRPVSFEQAVEWALEQGIPAEKIRSVVARYPEAEGAKALLGMAAFSGVKAPALAGFGGGAGLALLGGVAVLGLVLSKRKR